MERKNTPLLLVWFAVCFVVAPVQVAISQDVTAYGASFAQPGAFGFRPAEAQLASHSIPLLEDDLLGRLQEAEARIAALEAEREAGGATLISVDDGEEVGGPLHSLWHHWSTACDPEIPIAHMQSQPVDTNEQPKKWYEKINLRGYTQLRISEVLSREDGSAPPHHVNDRSVSEDETFLIRRARLILYGDISEHMHIYLQPDFAVTTPGSSDGNHFTQIRDWYADVYLDPCKVHRLRVGQSKVPYGWENLQSSSNRLPLERTDAINATSVRNERDLGVFYYWTPEYTQEMFKYVMDQGLKGSGNYGAFGVGAYTGQGGSFMEQNDNVHVVARLTWPFELDCGQVVELSMQGYTGKYTVLSSPISPLGVGAAARPAGTLETGNVAGIRDERLAWTAVWYPQPLGFQAEWAVGRGPGLNDAQTEVIERALYGGYVMTMYRHENDHGVWFPFARWTMYKGGYKSERNAPYSSIDEWELGLEWQINPQMELVGVYNITDRTNTRALSDPGEVSYGQFEGDMLRFHFQFNY